MSNSSFDEKYFDSILNQVLQDIEEEEIQKAQTLYEELKDVPEPKMSLRHKWRMKRLVKSFDDSNGRKKAYPFSRVVVTAAIVMTVVFSTSIFARADIFRLFQRLGFYSNEYVDISLSKDYTQSIVEATAEWPYGKVYVPGLIPDGYTLEEINVTHNAISMQYFSYDDDYFNFGLKALGENALASVDNREANIRKLNINGYEAVYYENNAENTLSYNTNEYFISLVSNALEEKELKKIAENLESLEKLVVK